MVNAPDRFSRLSGFSMLKRHRKRLKDADVWYFNPLSSDMHTALLLADDRTFCWGFLVPINCRDLKRDDLVCKGQGGLRSTHKADKALDRLTSDMLTCEGIDR